MGWQQCEFATLSAGRIIRFNNINLIHAPKFYAKFKFEELKIERK